MSEETELNGSGGRPSIWQVVSREILILMLTGAALFLGSLAAQYAWELKENIWLRGVQDFGLSFIEAALVMLIIEQRASREQVASSLRLIQNATAATTHQIDTATTATRTLIEESVKQAAEQTKDAIENLFDFVYKKKVPPAIVRLYEETAFKAPFFRTHHEYTCTFYDPEATPTPPGMIRATFYQKFTMHNLTGSEKIYNLSCETQLPATQAEKCKFDALMVDGVSVFARAKVTQVERVGYSAMLISHAERIPAGGSKDFQIRFENLRSRRDFEVVMMNWPSDGIVFRVTHPSTFEVTLAALHPQELRPVPTADISKEWELRAGFMIGQGVCLTWQENAAHE
jgi:hypothetical protein